MDNVVAKIYIILSVTTIFLFLLTHKVQLEIIKNENFVFSIAFVFFKLEFTKEQEQEESDASETENGIPPDTREVFSLISTILSHTKHCTVKIKSLILPIKIPNHESPMFFFGVHALKSAIFAYIDSLVEILSIRENAFILDPDKVFEIDLIIEIRLFNLIILAVRLIAKGIKIGKMEDTYVRN